MPIEKKKILITGGAGFIGSNLALTLQERHPEAEITVLDTFEQRQSFKNLAGYKGQIRLKNLVSEDALYWDEFFDVIFHLASNTDTTDDDLQGQIRNNVLGFKNVLNSACRHVIYASSASVYGPKTNSLSKESDPRNPANAYAFTKQQLENMAAVAKMDTTGFRFFNVYGPHEHCKHHSASMVTQIMKHVKEGDVFNLFEGGQQKRDWIYIKDLVELLITAMEKPVNGVFNAGSGQARSFNEIVRTAGLIYHKVPSPKFIPVKYDFFQEHTQADLTKVQAAFPTWSPKWKLEDAMKDYADKV
jgi:ADP-L-glycero-D-manno-heptose 6-epimerase